MLVEDKYADQFAKILDKYLPKNSNNTIKDDVNRIWERSNSRITLVIL